MKPTVVVYPLVGSTANPSGLPTSPWGLGLATAVCDLVGSARLSLIRSKTAPSTQHSVSNRHLLLLHPMSSFEEDQDVRVKFSWDNTEVEVPVRVSGSI
jgi:hypothetical protein